MSTLKRHKPKARRYRSTGFDAATTQAILDRDGCCVRCGGALNGERGWDYSIQHRRARGMGGSLLPDTNAPQNGIALCGSATTGCHGWVESNPVEAREAGGWAIRQTDDPLLVPVTHFFNGVIFLYSNGSWGSRPELPDDGGVHPYLEGAA
jgi:hypothetical protein